MKAAETSVLDQQNNDHRNVRPFFQKKTPSSEIGFRNQFPGLSGFLEPHQTPQQRKFPVFQGFFEERFWLEVASEQSQLGNQIWSLLLFYQSL